MSSERDAADGDDGSLSSRTDPGIRKTPAGQATGPDTDTILQTEQLTKRFGGLTAIDAVDFGIDEGELRCLIGPNGAGKSTMLKLITGRHRATEGRIYYDGVDVTELSSHERVRRGIGIKFQEPSVFDSLSAAENVRLPLQRTGNGAVSERIDETLDRVGLLEEGETPASDLSHGQQQRLEIGMAAALSPSLLLLDEPVAGLSIEEREEIAALVTELNEEGMTLIVIEHDIDFVDRIADRVTVLNQGSIFREGDIDEIRADEEVREIYLGET
jgi:branched-chain amino acid transport system ATP-binding protein